MAIPPPRYYVGIRTGFIHRLSTGVHFVNRDASDKFKRLGNCWVTWERSRWLVAREKAGTYLLDINMLFPTHQTADNADNSFVQTATSNLHRVPLEKTASALRVYRIVAEMSEPCVEFQQVGVVIFTVSPVPRDKCESDEDGAGWVTMGHARQRSGWPSRFCTTSVHQDRKPREWRVTGADRAAWLRCGLIPRKFEIILVHKLPEIRQELTTKARGKDARSFELWMIKLGRDSRERIKRIEEDEGRTCNFVLGIYVGAAPGTNGRPSRRIENALQRWNESMVDVEEQAVGNQFDSLKALVNKGPQMRSRLAEIGRQIALLQNEQTTIQNALAALIYPVLTLPTEITSEIPTWRDIAVHDTRLWNSFRVVYLGRERSSFLKAYLDRAGTRPLDMDIEYDGVEETLPLLLQDIFRRSSQWQTVALNFRSSTLQENFQAQMDFSSLETLTILSTEAPMDLSRIGAFTTAPKLRVVTLRNCWSSGLSPSSAFPWSQLTKLNVEGCTEKLCCDLLCSTPNLIDFTSSPIWVEHDPSDTLFSPHLHLKRLSVGGAGSDALFGRLNLPKLEQLEVRDLSDDPESQSGLLAFLARSAQLSRFTCLISDYAGGGDPLLLPLFGAMPKFSELNLTAPAFEVNIILRNIRDSPSFLPCIQTIRLKIPYDDGDYNITARVLSETLSSRWNSEPDVIALRSFSLVWEEDMIQEMDTASFVSFIRHPQLLELKRQGMNIHVGTQDTSWV
ncbi:hypothetical protein B0H16DRAFT_1698186 [Mycena metata]|uniref:Uncharacterized protein n=1 Tax=Mycena metata TaxID=1033252 RepID=A0AAD7HRS0_9AGAR|nr:hypothetical protein B0H16DRAFT_1698186 [Mycena metata]